MLAMAVATNEKGDISNIARIANAVPVTLYSRVTMIVNIVVLNCQKCNQCLKCQISAHKSIGLLFEGVFGKISDFQPGNGRKALKQERSLPVDGT